MITIKTRTIGNLIAMINAGIIYILAFIAAIIDIFGLQSETDSFEFAEVIISIIAVSIVVYAFSDYTMRSSKLRFVVFNAIGIAIYYFVEWWNL